MKVDARLATTGAMLILMGGIALMSLGLPSKAAFMPLLVSVPGALLCLAQLVVDLRDQRREPAVSGEASEGPDIPEEREGSSELTMFVWLAVFTVVLLTLGFVVGGTLCVLAFVRLNNQGSWERRSSLPPEPFRF
jgi:hypothetical protein